MTVVMFLLGLPMITRNGIYVFQLMDFYAASGMSLLWCVFFQTIAICWVFGAKRFYGCIEEMIGYRVSYYWLVCWVSLAPAFMVFIFIFYFVKYTPITMGDYQYPGWGEALGFLISLSSMIWVPGYMVYYFIATPGSWREVLIKGTTPTIIPRDEAAKCREMENIKKDDVEKQLLEKNEEQPEEDDNHENRSEASTSTAYAQENNLHQEKKILE